MSSLIISYDIGFPSSSAMEFGTFKVLSNNIIISPVMFRNDRLCINIRSIPSLLFRDLLI